VGGAFTALHGPPGRRVKPALPLPTKSLPFHEGFVGQGSCQQLRACARHFEGAKLAESLMPPQRFEKRRLEVAGWLRARIHRKLVEVLLAAQICDG
jgi:hypothetical protein